MAETAYNIAGGEAGNDLDMALEIATLANELTGGTNLAVMHTMAGVHAARKEYPAAIEWEEKSIAILDQTCINVSADAASHARL